MNRKHKKSKRRKKVIRVWTYPQAKNGLPYITSVMRSLREHWLDAQRHDLASKRLTEQPGRHDRQTILDREEALHEGGRAKERFNQAFQELQAIEVYCIDPNQGMAVIPFVHDDRLAWLIYDLFTPKELEHWRYHDDPLELRRPIAEALEDPGPNQMAV
jgi:hypothetical protein